MQTRWGSLMRGVMHANESDVFGDSALISAYYLQLADADDANPSRLTVAAINRVVPDYR